MSRSSYMFIYFFGSPESNYISHPHSEFWPPPVGTRSVTVPIDGPPISNRRSYIEFSEELAGIGIQCNKDS